FVGARWERQARRGMMPLLRKGRGDHSDELSENRMERLISIHELAIATGSREAYTIISARSSKSGKNVKRQPFDQPPSGGKRKTSARPAGEVISACGGLLDKLSYSLPRAIVIEDLPSIHPLTE